MEAFNNCRSKKLTPLIWYSYYKIIFRNIESIFEEENWLWKINFHDFLGLCSTSVVILIFMQEQFATKICRQDWYEKKDLLLTGIKYLRK